MASFTYEKIGAGYTNHRRAEHRLVRRVLELLALSQGSRIVDVGAGTGNYAAALAEQGYWLIAVEPAALMRHQARSIPGVLWLGGAAEALPLAADAANGVICMLALHHMRSIPIVVREMRRVVPTGPLLIFSFDPRLAEPWWFESYFPTVWHAAFDFFPPINDVFEQLQPFAVGGVEIVPFALPHDLIDRFTAAGWRTPEIYLDPAVRAGMSAFALADQGAINEGIAMLADDLETCHWHRQNDELLRRETLDVGYRFLIVR